MKDYNLSSKLKPLCGMIFVVSALLSSNAIATTIITGPAAPQITSDQAREILLFQEEFPNGRRAERVHFNERTPEYQQWTYENGTSVYQMKQKERRYVALGGRPAIRVNTNVQAQYTVNSLPNGIGYIFR